MFAFWVVASWEVSFLIFVRGILAGEDRLKSILLFKFENLVVSEAGIYSGKLERMLRRFSLVQRSLALCDYDIKGGHSIWVITTGSIIFDKKFEHNM